MYLITNRHLKKIQGSVDIFDSKPNLQGANELRIVELKGSGKNITATVLADELSKARVTELKTKFQLNIDTSKRWFISLEIACNLFERARKEKKHILLYVHGYNNNVQDIVATAHSLEKTYNNLIVVPFSWPAKGGGAISGTANYLNDKRDARASEGALDRVFETIRNLHALLVESQSDSLWQKAIKKHGENHEATRAEFVKLQSRICKVSINLLCHSMGNYLLKHATLPLGGQIRRLIFDNICLVAPDTNNIDHALWVSKIEYRGSIYVVINENDHALQWSRRKPGDEQLARLGHYLKGLNARNVTYIDVTNAAHVRDDHSYYQGEAPKRNVRLKKLFASMFSGEHPEHQPALLRFFPENNAYRLK